MAGTREVRQYAPTCPGGTGSILPTVFNLVMPARTVFEIRVRVPPGPLGSLAFQIGSAGEPIIPINDNAFIVGDDEEFVFALDHAIDSGAWQAIMINKGFYDHTIYITFICELPDLPSGATATAPLPAESLGPQPAVIMGQSVMNPPASTALVAP